MIAKTTRLPHAHDARIRRAAKANKRTYSTVMRAAIVRGLESPKGINMAEALKDFIGSTSGPGEPFDEQGIFP